MASIRIIATPPGEAPEEVRRAWVGLVVPIGSRHASGPSSVHGVGVVTGPHGWLRRLWAVVTGRTEKIHGFVLSSRRCIELLDAHAPAAAAWWRSNTPHLLQPGQALVFPAESCEVFNDADA